MQIGYGLAMNEKGELVLLLGIMITLIGLGAAHSMRSQENAHKKAMHNEQYHKDAVKAEEATKESLRKAKLYKI